MKRLLIFIIFCFVPILLFGQSTVTISKGSSISVGSGSDLASGYRDGTMQSNGSFNSRSIVLDPVAIAASGVGSSTFNANWNASAGSTGYKLDVSTDVNFGSFLTGFQDLSVGVVTSYAVNGLTTGTTYYYRVRATDVDGITGYSNVIIVVTAPAAPVASAATNVGETSFSANWGAVTGATKYYLDVATDNLFTSMVAGWTNVDVGNVVTYSVNTNLTGNTTYYYRVRAASTGGTGSNSNTITLTSAPAAPTASAATSLAQTSFAANWSSQAGATKYYLDVATTSGFTAGTFITGFQNLDVGNVTTYSVNSGLTAGSTYYFRVRAGNGSGNSNNSNTITVLTVPPTPVATAAASLTQTSFSANWGAATSATKYYIDVATDNAFTAPVAGWTNVDMGNVLTYSVNSNLSAGTTYYYRIRSENASGASGNSNIITVLTISPNPVTSAADNITTTSFSANWAVSSNATKYYLDVSTSNLFAGFVTGWNNVDVGNVTTYSVNSNLTPGTTYYFRVRAYSASGTSENSNVTSLITVPSAPVELAASSVSSTSFNANWNAAAGASKYYLDVATDNLFTSMVAGWTNVDVGNVTAYSVNSALTASTNYYYRVRAFNAGGTSANSGTTTVLTAPTAPVATAATANASTSFDANWNVTAGASGYILDVATDVNFTAGTFVGGYNGLDVTNVLTYTVNLNLTPGATYYYRVRAYNAGGTGVNSNIITTAASPAPPIAAAATANASTSFSANWNSSAGATGYRLDVSTASDFSSFVAGFNNLDVNNVTTYSVTGLTANTTHYYRVRAYNNYGNSTSSSNITVLTAPSAPVEIAASSVSQLSFTANWNAAAGATGYYLDVSTVANFASFVSGYNNLDVGSVTSRSVSLPSGGSTYYYRVRAYSGGGTSPNSGTQTVVTLPASPVATPASAISATGFTANWNASANATGYRFDASTDPLFGAGNFLAGLEDLDVTNVTSKVVNGLSAGNTYYFRVRAYNATGAGANSNVISVITIPAAPSEQAASSITNNGFTANWLSSTGASGYKLDISTASDFSSFVPGYQNVDVGNATSYAATALSSGAAYYYRIRAYNTAGTSASSGTINLTTSGLAPRAPAVNPATAIATTQFDANWTASAGATKYYLDVATDNAFTSILPAYTNKDAGAVTTYTVSGLTAGTVYYYRVRAFNADGTSGNSSKVSVYTIPDAPVDQPAAAITNSGFDAKWLASTGATGYKLDVSTASDFSSFVTGYQGLDVANVTTFTVTGLLPSTQYYYQVRAYNTGGTSTNCPSVNPLTLANPAGTFSSAAATAIGETGFTANWIANGGTTAGYKLDVSTDPAFGSFVGIYHNLDVANVITYGVTGLTGGTTYYYRTTAYDSVPADIATSTSVTVLTIPAAPVVGSASLIGATNFTANWSASTGATGYYIDVATDAALTSFVTGFQNKYVNSTTSFLVTGLTPGTQYYYQVRGKNGSGISANSSSASLYTLPLEPAVSSASNISGSAFDANWSSSTGATKYYIDVATDAGFTSILPAWTNVDVGNSTSTTINTGLSSGTIYYYRLRANNTGGTSGNSSLVSLETAPAAPVSNNPSAISQTGFTANWASSTGATKYFLDVSTASDFSSYVTGYQNLDVSDVVTYPVSGLAGGTDYFYRVRAFNSNGTSTNSGNKTATTVPPDPGALPATNILSTEFKAKWNASTGATKYYLDVATDNLFTAPVAGWNNKDVGNVTEYTVNSGLTVNTTYYYRVRAYNASGTSNNSGIITTATSPSAPVATAAGALQETSLAANWNASAGADGYYLDISTANDFSSYVAGYQNLNVSNVTTYSAAGLTGGTTYYYRIRSYTGGKPSDNSNVITALTKPAAPVSSAGSSVATTSFDANWNSSASATGYKLEVSANSGFTSYLAGYGPKDVGNVTTYSISGLTANTNYYYRISAYNATGTGLASTIKQVLTAPVAPTTSAATSITNTTLVANWSSVAGATGYRIDVATDAGFTSILLAYTNKDVGNVTSASVAGLNGSITYYYRVRAYNTGGTSGNSGTTNVTTSPDPSAPPVATAGTALAVTSFTANWGAVGAASGYALDVATDNLFTNILAGYNDLNVGNVTTYSVTGLSSGTTYYYRTRSYNVSGVSSNSNVITILTSPAAPVSSASTSLAETSFTANWAASTGATKYYLDVSTSNTFASFVAGYNDKDVSNVTTYSVTGLTGGTTYYYRVRSYNASGTSSNSGDQTALTLPAAPVSSAASTVTETSFSANWAASTGATKYYLDLSTSNTFASFVTGYNNKDVSNVTTYSITGLTANTTYYYRVRAYDASGNSANSSTITVVGLPTSSAATAKFETGFTANWTQVAGATKYYIDVSTASDFTAILPAYNNLDAGDVALYAVTSLSANTTYYYRIRANNATGTSGNSSSITVLTSPAAPVASAATSITPAGFTVNWGASAGATGYYLDIATDAAFTDFLTGYQNKDEGNILTENITGIERGTTYYYRVRAYNASAYSSNSGTISILAAPLAGIATDIMQNSFSANWNSVTGATKYYFDAATDPGFTSFLAGYNNKDVGNVITINIAGLTKNTEYFYRVRSFDGSTLSGNSDAISVRTLPDAPTANAATAVTQTDFSANWIIPGGSAPGYRLDVASDAAFTNILASYNNLATGNVLTYSVTGLTPGTTYYYRVRAQNSWGASDNSNVISVLLKPANPTAASATGVTTSEMTINWLAAASATGYTIDIASDNGFTSMRVNNLNVGNVLNYTLTGLSSNTTYYYRVRAFNATGSSLNSNVMQATTLAEKPILSKIESAAINYNVKQSIASITDSLRLQCPDSSPVRTVTVQVNSYVNGEDQLSINSTNGITGSWSIDTGTLVLTGNATNDLYEQAIRNIKYTNNSLQPTSFTKQVTIVANNGFFDSDPVTRSVTIKQGNDAPVLSGMEVNKLVYLKGISPLRIPITDSLLTIDSDNFYLTGATVKIASGYIKAEDNIDFNNTSTLTAVFSKDTGILTITGKGTVQSYQAFLRDLSYRNSSAANGTSSRKTFEFAVHDGLVNSASVIRQFEIKAPLETPGTLSGAITSNHVDLTWSDTNTGERGYIIERSEGNNTLYTELARVDSNTIHFSDLTIRNGIKYYYRVAAYKNTLKSDYGNEISIIGIVVGISDKNGIPKEYVVSQNYPNPFNPTTTIIYGMPFESKVRIEIYNAIGQLIEVPVDEMKAPGYYRMNWKASGYASGIYIYRISAVSIDRKNNFTDTKRMILIK